MNAEYRNKLSALRSFLFTYKDLPAQGSDEWKKQRMHTIGGSEMSVISGTNKYKNIAELVKDKIGMNTFNGNFRTHWGKVFEPASQRLLEILFKCKLYETGSLPGCIPGTTYSPDGFAVAENTSIYTLIEKGVIKEHTLPTNKATTILFEIKSPWGTEPDGKIPTHYLSQPLSGIGHFPFVDIAYFANFAFKKCTMADLNFTSLNYDVAYHEYYEMRKTESYIGKYMRDQPNNKVYAIGLIGIYDKSATNNLDCWNTQYSNNFNTILKNTADCIYDAYYFDPIIREDLHEPNFDISRFEKYCNKNNYTIIDYIPYKLLRYDIIPVYRDPSFVQNLKPQIDEIINNVQIINNSKDKLSAYNKIYNKIDKINVGDIDDIDNTDTTAVSDMIFSELDDYLM